MDERRGLDRYRTNRSARITVSGGGTIECRVFDLSTTGVCLIHENPQAIPDTFSLMIEHMGVRQRCCVAWRSKTKIGVAFK